MEQLEGIPGEEGIGGAGIGGKEYTDGDALLIVEDGEVDGSRDLLVCEGVLKERRKSAKEEQGMKGARERRKGREEGGRMKGG